MPDPRRTFPGTLLLAMEDNQAPEIAYSPNRIGWHRIYVGIYWKPFEEAKAVDVRLSRDTGFTTLEGGEGAKDHQKNLQDCDGRTLYEEVYCVRGDTENRIKGAPSELATVQPVKVRREGKASHHFHPLSNGNHGSDSRRFCTT